MIFTVIIIILSLLLLSLYSRVFIFSFWWSFVSTCFYINICFQQGLITLLDNTDYNANNLSFRKCQQNKHTLINPKHKLGIIWGRREYVCIHHISRCVIFREWCDEEKTTTHREAAQEALYSKYAADKKVSVLCTEWRRAKTLY